MPSAKIADIAADTTPESTDIIYGTDAAGTTDKQFALGTIASTFSAPLRLTINAQTGTTYTPVLSDEQKLVTLSNAGAITVTLPQDSDVAFPVGGQIHFTQLGAGAVTFAAGTGATVNAIALGVSDQYGTVTAIKRAADTWLLVGALA